MKTWFIAILLFMLCAGHAQAQVGLPLPELGSAALEGSHVFVSKAGPPASYLYNLTIEWHTALTTRWLLFFNSTSLPANGVTANCGSGQAAGCLAYCWPISTTTADQGQAFSWLQTPVTFSKGLTIAFSTTECATLTVDGANDRFYAQVGP